MSLPHILLVDDSEAILAYEKATLSSHYTLSTAMTGLEALEKIPLLRPDLVLLDLSMPQMDGEEVLKRCKQDPVLADTLFIVVSAEHERAEACRALGATEVMGKPIRAAELIALVDRVLEQARIEDHDKGLSALLVEAGGTWLGLPLSAIHSVLLQPECYPLQMGPFYMSEIFEYEGQPVCVLDLTLRLGLEHTQPRVERKLVLVKVEDHLLAVNVDDVTDPEEFAHARVTLADQIAGSSHRPLDHALIAIVSTDSGPVPIVDPKSFISSRALRELLLSVESQGTPGDGAT